MPNKLTRYRFEGWGQSCPEFAEFCIMSTYNVNTRPRQVGEESFGLFSQNIAEVVYSPVEGFYLATLAGTPAGALAQTAERVFHVTLLPYEKPAPRRKAK